MYSVVRHETNVVETKVLAVERFAMTPRAACRRPLLSRDLIRRLVFYNATPTTRQHAHPDACAAGAAVSFTSTS